MRETFDYSCVLIKQSEKKRDKYGNPIPAEESRTEVLCAVKSATRAERNISAQEGFKAVLVLVIHPYEYQDEKKVEFEGKIYDIGNIYLVDYERMELTLGEKLRDRK